MTDAPLYQTDLSPAARDRRAKRNVMVLVAAQAILGAQMPMIFVLAGLAGQSLTANPCFATLPISIIVLFSMLTANPMAALMQRAGRRTGFVIGTFCGAMGGAIGAVGLFQQSFALFLLGSAFSGIYFSSQGFFRFAATDTASAAFKPKAISWVMAGGLVAAVIGPELVKWTSNAIAVPFLGTYIAIVVVNMVGIMLFALLDIPVPEAPPEGAPQGRTRWQLLTTPRIAVAIICAMVSYALMNLMMTATPLAVVGCGFTEGHAAEVVRAHVLAMFAPSFFTGHLIARFGVERIVAIGLTLLGAAGVAGLAGVDLHNFFIALILLGLGWNFGFIGATAMLASAHTPEEQGRVQGMNDMLVFGCVTVASLASGGLMNCAAATPQSGWASINYAMAPFLVLAAGALWWLAARAPRATAS
ncbi:MAG: MFS transporter [Pseudomonadota bacterium]